MSNLKDIRKRIITVKNTQKITRVMTMISAAKLNKARQGIENSRPYHQELQNIFFTLYRCAPESLEKFSRKKENKKTAVLLYTSDRGLCGAFNSNLCKKVFQFLAKRETDLYILGKKGKDFFSGTDFSEVNFSIQEGYYQKKEDELKNDVSNIAKKLIEKFLSKEYDEVYLAFNYFVSSVVCEPKIQKLLPLEEKKEEKGESSTAIFEPSLKKIANQLLPSYLENLCYLCLLDSFACEHASRMRVMDAATNNARDLIVKLQMQYNRARQANITTELTEIISGAESV